MAVREFKKGSDVYVGKYFQAKEFDCPCPDPHPTLIDQTLVDLLDKVHALAGRLVYVDAGHRCQAREDYLAEHGFQTAKKYSQHVAGKAADFRVLGLPGTVLAEHAREAGFKAVGIAKDWIHGDTRSDREYHWTYQIEEPGGFDSCHPCAPGEPEKDESAA